MFYFILFYYKWRFLQVAHMALKKISLAVQKLTEISNIQKPNGTSNPEFRAQTHQTSQWTFHIFSSAWARVWGHPRSPIKHPPPT